MVVVPKFKVLGIPIVAFFVAMGVLCGGVAFADDPIEPLAETWKNRIVPKHKAIITYMNNNNYTLQTFRAQGTEVNGAADLSGFHKDLFSTTMGDLNQPGRDRGMPSAIASAGGQVRDTLKLDHEFYTQTEFPDVPLGVLCNAYVITMDPDGVRCDLVMELTNKDGRIGNVLLSGVPMPAYKYYYRTQKDKESMPSPTLDSNIVTDLQAHDWNGDGFTDYVVSYIHNTLGNNKYDGNKADLLRVALLYVDGKSLYNAIKSNDSSAVSWKSEISPVFGDWTEEVKNGDKEFIPANSARTAIGDLDYDDVPEVVLYHTKVGGSVSTKNLDGADNGLHVFKLDTTTGSPVTFKKLYERLSDAGASVIQCDSVGVTVGDIDGDGINELITAHAKNPATGTGNEKKYKSEIYLDVFKYNNDPNNSVTSSFTKVVIGKRLTDWYNSFDEDDRNTASIPPIELEAGDFDGDGVDEVAYLGIDVDRTYEISLWIVKWGAGVDLGSNPAPSFSQRYTISHKYGWRLDDKFSRYSMTTGLFNYPDGDAHVKLPRQIAIAHMGGSSTGNANLRNLDWGIFSWRQATGSDRNDDLKLLGKGMAIDVQKADNVVPQIVAADIDNEAMILGEPTRIDVTGNIELIAAIQAPPTHWDVVDYGGGSVSIDVFATMSNYYTSYSTSSTTTNIVTDVEASESSFGIGGTKSKSQVNKFKDNTPISSKTKEFANTTAAETTKSASRSLTVAADAVAAADDILYYNAMKYTIWRYPVLFPLSQRLVEVTDEDGVKSMEQKFLQIVVPEQINGEVLAAEGRDISWYEPNHDNRNLFTYPRNISAKTVLGYPAGINSKESDDPWKDINGLVLLDQAQAPIGNQGASSGTIKLNSEVSESQMSSITRTTGSNSSRTIPIGSAKMTKLTGKAKALTVNLTKDKSYQTSSTTKTNASQMAGINVNWPGTGSGNNMWKNVAGMAGEDMKFTAKVSVYVQDDGAIATAYSVSEFDNKHKMWGSETSPFFKRPDIALNLPHRYKASLTRNTTDEALLIRGFYFDEAAVKVANSADIGGKALPKNTEVTGHFRIFNASFVDSGIITVKMFHQPIEGRDAPDLSKAEEMDAVLTFENTIRGRGEGVNYDNWIDANFKWTTPDTTGLGFIHVVVEHEGDELTTDNNYGYALVGTYDPAQFDSLSGSSARSVARGGLIPDSFFDDAGIVLSVTSAKVFTESGSEITDHNNLPNDENLVIECNVKAALAEGSTSPVRAIPFVRAMLFADESLVAGRHVPLIKIGNEWTFRLTYRHRDGVYPSSLRIVGSSPFLSDDTDESGTGDLGRLNFASGDDPSGSGSSGCDAGVGALLAVFALTLGAMRKKCRGDQ